MQERYYRLVEVTQRTLDALASPFKEWEDIENLVTEAAMICFGGRKDSEAPENESNQHSI